MGSLAVASAAFLLLQSKERENLQIQQAENLSSGVHSWGSGLFGQLGNGNEKQAVTSPELITDLVGEDIRQVSASGDMSAAVTEEGDLYTWGKTKPAFLGSVQQAKGAKNLLQPTYVQAQGVNFKKVSCGKQHTAAITSNGKLITWGNPDKGKLGHTKKEESEEEIAKRKDEYKRRGYQPKNYEDSAEMDFVYGALENEEVTQVECGFYHTVALTSKGEVFSWGEGKQGALGHGDWEEIDLPKKIEGLSDIVSIQSGGAFTVALDSKGSIYSWGQNRYGQLGQINTNASKTNSPQQINLPGSVKIAHFSCGEEHSALVTQKGQVFTWGYGNDGQLGHKERQNLTAPKKLFFEQKVQSVSCGGGHTGLITEKNEVFLFGRGRDGQLGRGDELESMAAYRTEPKRVEKLKGSKVSQLALGQNHSMAVLLK